MPYRDGTVIRYAWEPDAFDSLFRVRKNGWWYTLDGFPVASDETIAEYPRTVLYDPSEY